MVQALALVQAQVMALAPVAEAGRIILNLAQVLAPELGPEEAPGVARIFQ